MAVPPASAFPHIQALVFDLDGTLIDSVPGIAVALSGAFLAVDRTFNPSDLTHRLRGLVGPPITVMARDLDPSLTNPELLLLEHTFRLLYDNEGWRSALPYPEVADTLHALHRQGLRLFVITNKPCIPTTGILAQLGFEDLFCEVLSRDSRTPPFATKADMLGDLVSRHRVDPTTALMVGDTLEDGAAAAAHHLKFLHVTYGYGPSLGAVHPIHRFSEITTLFDLHPRC